MNNEQLQHDRLLLMIPLIFGITLMTFVVIHLAPGNPVEVQTEMSLKVTAQAKENMKKLYGLDKPLHLQYIDWLKRFQKPRFRGIICRREKGH